MEDSFSEKFGDVKTSTNHPQDDQILIISRNSNDNNNNIHKSMEDQFASSLLRLQAGLDSTTARLQELENKINQIQKKQNQLATNSSSSPKDRNTQIILTLIQLGWPLVVYVAIKAIERRALKNKI